MTMLLDGHGLMGHLTGATPPPPTTILTNDVNQENLTYKTLLLPLLSLPILQKQTWILWHTLHANKSHTRIYSLKDQLTDRVIKGLKGVFQYLLEIKMISDELAIVGAPISYEELTVNILSGLNSDFKKVSASIRTCDTPVEYEVLFKSFLTMNRFSNMKIKATHTLLQELWLQKLH
uniref:Reverse transcriptase Ty1/copia-type domain-containing protein n=1 Tax=Gossypium raimondii TaxID=29730 RepID=A0A0D2PV74_GOSRA|nr:hypothetical protein B456_001G219800 [Gossypium raimondii]